MVTHSQNNVVRLSLEMDKHTTPRTNTNGDANSNLDSDSQSTPCNEEHLSGVSLVLLVLSLMLGVFLLALDLTILSNAIPSITRSFHSLHDVAWYSSAFSLTTAPLQSAYGKAYHYFDQRNTFLISIAIFELGSLLSALASNSPMLIIGRAVSGIGGGGIVTGAFSIIACAAPPRLVSTCMGLLGVIFGLASVVGPLLGGALTSGPGWRWCFWINLPLGAIAAAVVLAVFTTPEAAKPPSGMSTSERLLQMDPAGVLLVVVSEVCFVLAMQMGGKSGGNFAQPVCIGLLITSAIVLVVLVGLEWRLGERGMIQCRLLRNPLISANVAVIFFVAAVYYPSMYTLPIYFQSIKGASASNSGIWSIPLILGVSVFVIISNTSMPRVHWTLWLVLGPTIIVAGTVCLYTLDPNTNLTKLLGFQLFTGAGIGLVLQVPLAANQKLVASGDIPAVIGMTLFFESIGNVILGAVVEASFVARLVARIGDSYVLASAGVEPSSVLEAGATGFRIMFPENVALILDCYMDGVKRAILILVVCASASLVFACVSIVVYLAHRRHYDSASASSCSSDSGLDQKDEEK